MSRNITLMELNTVIKEWLTHKAEPEGSYEEDFAEYIVTTTLDGVGTYLDFTDGIKIRSVMISMGGTGCVVEYIYIKRDNTYALDVSPYPDYKFNAIKLLIPSIKKTEDGFSFGDLTAKPIKNRFSGDSNWVQVIESHDIDALFTFETDLMGLPITGGSHE
jgi:hypothetical protein